MSRILLLTGIGLVLVVLIVTVVILVIRRPKGPAPGRPTSTGPVTLTIWQPIDSEDIWQPIIAEYQTENPAVKIVYVQRDLANYEIEVINAISGDQGPDLWAVHNSWMVKHRDKLAAAPEGLLRSTNKQDKRTNETLVNSAWAPIVAAEALHDQKLYGLPMSVDTLVFYANNQLLNDRRRELLQAQVEFDQQLLTRGPRTWEEFITLVKLVTKKTGNEINLSAVAIGTATNNARATDLLAALMLQNGTQMESPDRLTATFNLPAQKSTGEPFNPGLNALDFFTSFARPGQETYTWNNSFPEAVEAFLQGKVAIVPGYSWLGNLLLQRNPDFQFRLFPLPQILGSSPAVDFANYWLVGVSRHSKNPEAAWAFIKFLATTGLPSYTSSTNRPSPLKAQANVLPSSVLERTVRGSPFRFQSETARPWYRGKQPQKVEAAMAQMIEDVVSRQVPSENALNKAAKTVTEIFRSTTPLPTQPPQ